MPTGYTASIKDGISFKDFALNCARAFGACVTLRDEGGGGEKIPEAFDPSTYHAEKLVALGSELSAIHLMTPDELNGAAVAAYERQELNRLKSINEMKELRKKYEAMLNSVNSWVPPSEEFQKFQEFMREQIESSLRFDCDTDYYDKPTEKLSRYEWKAKKIKTIMYSIEYHKNADADEIERTNKRNEWIKSLRDSLAN